LMCVDSVKFNSDEKQLTRLFISLFASDGGGGGPCDAMRSGIRMTITLQGHPMSMT